MKLVWLPDDCEQETQSLFIAAIQSDLVDLENEIDALKHHSDAPAKEQIERFYQTLSRFLYQASDIRNAVIANHVKETRDVADTE